MLHKTTLKTNGIVLRTTDYLESDRIVVLLTEDAGKITGIAKGARKSRIRFANVLEPFSHLSLVLSQKKGNRMAFIEEAATIHHYPAIRANLEKTLTASYFMELMEQFLWEEKSGTHIFQLACEYLALMEENHEGKSFVRFFELRFLQLLGYEPVLDRCTICASPLQSSSSYGFSPSAGGIQCPGCIEQRRTADIIPASVGAIRTLLLGKNSPPLLMERIIMTEQCACECRLLLCGFIRHLLGKELKSLSVLHEIQKMNL
ncbi:MAG: DNA repair protein RecO [Syntrophobacterales bacterium]|jgi:DNA repair protein RecO (recombination protein O)|nr:DNA repair protein RecO [Syntrophobacterales bacterium]